MPGKSQSDPTSIYPAFMTMKQLGVSLLFLLLAQHCSAQLTSGASDVAARLLACYQQEPSDKKHTVRFQDYMAGIPTRLHLHAVVSKPENEPHSETPPPLTVVTALNTARLDTLLLQCQSWPGPLVAAMYVPLLRHESTISPQEPQDGPSTDEVAELQAAQQLAEDTLQRSTFIVHGCQLRILILYEYVSSQFLANLIPINALRNAAILAATTPLISMIDVDLLISRHLGEQLVTGPFEDVKTRQSELIKKCAGGASVILPAFQTPKNRSINGYPEGPELERGVQLVQDLISKDKKAVFEAVQRNEVIKFASQQFAVGHRRTDFPRWFRTEEWYEVQFVPQFEPWFVTDRLHTPFYDVNFRGYGRNKQQQAVHASAIGHTFWVHPNAYVIHAPHSKSAAQKDHDKSFESRFRRWRNHKGPVKRRQLLQDAGIEGKEHVDISMIDSNDIAMQARMHVRRVDRLFRRFVKLMMQPGAGGYRTLQDPAALKCLRQLPWWAGTSVLQWSTVEPNQPGKFDLGL